MSDMDFSIRLIHLERSIEPEGYTYHFRLFSQRDFSVQWRLTAVFPNALHHTGKNQTEDKRFTVSPKIMDYLDNG
jgi:hypothetical protein